MQLMGKYIFIRHGESNINVLGVLSGDSDVSGLTEKGNMQFIINLYLTNNTYYSKPSIYTSEINEFTNPLYPNSHITGSIRNLIGMEDWDDMISRVKSLYTQKISAK